MMCSRSLSDPVSVRSHRQGPGVSAFDRVDIACPSDVRSLLRSRTEGRQPLAGGTDLLVSALAKGRVGQPLVWTGGIRELQTVKDQDSRIHVGAATTLTHALASSLATRAPAVADGMRILGSGQIRNVATLAGNLCNASPAADTAPGLAVHSAKIEIQCERIAPRLVDLSQFVTGPGMTALGADELVTGIEFEPLKRGEFSCYRRAITRKSMDLAFASVALRVGVELRTGAMMTTSIALGAVGPTVIRADAAAEPLIGQRPESRLVTRVADGVAELCEPISDLRCSADYRRHLIRVLMRELLPAAYDRALARSEEME